MTLATKLFSVRAVGAVVFVVLLARAASAGSGWLIGTLVLGGIVLVVGQGLVRLWLIHSAFERLAHARSTEDTAAWDRSAKELFTWQSDDPDLAGLVHTERGLWLIHHKKFDEALALFEAALKSAPDGARRISRQNNIAWTLYLAGRAADALPHARAAVAAAELNKEGNFLPYCLGTLGGILVQTGELEEARQVMERSLSLSDGTDPRDEAIRHYFLAEAVKAADPKLAQEHFEKAVSLAPESDFGRKAAARLAGLGPEKPSPST